MLSKMGQAGSIISVGMRVAASDWCPSRRTVLLKTTGFIFDIFFPLEESLLPIAGALLRMAVCRKLFSFLLLNLFFYFFRLLLSFKVCINFEKNQSTDIIYMLTSRIF